MSNYKPEHRKNKLNFVVYSLPFQANVGGVIALYTLSSIIDNIGIPCKIYDNTGVNLPNEIFNKYATKQDVNENTIVIYPEIIPGNPLNANYVIRWILCELGINCPERAVLTRL